MTLDREDVLFLIGTLHTLADGGILGAAIQPVGTKSKIQRAATRLAVLLRAELEKTPPILQ